MRGQNACERSVSSAAGPVRIHGLDLPVATALVQTLTAATAAETDDAT